jgi:hypothetical protein
MIPKERKNTCPVIDLPGNFHFEDFAPAQNTPARLLKQ